MLVKDLNFKYTIREPSDYFEGTTDDICIAAYPTPDIRFAIYMPTSMQRRLEPIWAQSAMSYGHTNLSISDYDLRRSPNLKLIDLAEIFLQTGDLITNPESGLLQYLGEFPPLGLEVAA